MTSFVAEDGTGLSTATSLVSVAYADDYFTLRGNAIWSALDTTAKQKNLVLATDYVEFRYGASFISTRLTDEQSLSFPRNLVETFPDRIKKAVCEYAILSSGGTLISEPILVGGQMLKRKRERLIQFEEELHFASSSGGGGFIPHPIADSLIAPYVSQGGKVIR